MRGYCFGIESTREDAECFCTDDLMELSGIEFDFAADCDATANNQASPVDEMIERLSKTAGVLTTKYEPDEDSEATWPTYAVTFTEEGKRNWFAKRFESLKAKVNEMTLDEFALQDPTDLRLLVEYTCGDAVWHNGCFSSLDYFIREAIVGQPYYVTYAVLLH